MKAPIREKREVAEGTLLVLFDVSGSEVDYVPGQYFWVELPNVGYDDDRGLRRHISIVTSPTEPGVMGLCTRIRDTAFKRTLKELSVGTDVEVEEPKGDFRLPGDTGGKYVFVAGGIGITVFRSMLRYIADEALPYNVTLVYSNRNRAGTAFFDELLELEEAIPDLRVVMTMTDEPDWPGEQRRIDPEMLREHIEGQLGDYTYLVAGPPGMVEGVADAIQAEGVAEERVLRSRFAGY